MYAGFHCKRCQKNLTRIEALEHFPFEHGGLLPAAVIEAIWQHEEDPRRTGDHISPSMAGGCMREHAINRTHQIYIDPFKVLKMQAGTFWHEVMAKYSPPGWLPEVSFPRYGLEMNGIDPDSDRLAEDGRTGSFRKYRGIWEYEIWDGLWFSWQIDSLHGSYKHFLDYKNTDCPPAWKDKKGVWNYAFKEWPASDDNRLQMSIYAYGTQKVLNLPATPLPMIWKQTQGVQDPDMCWKPVDVELFDEGELVDIIRPKYEMFLKAMRAGTQLAVSELPLDGLDMYHGHKCLKFCGVKNICDNLTGGIRDQL